MRAGKHKAFGFQYAIEIDEIAFVGFNGFGTCVAFVLEIFEKSCGATGENRCRNRGVVRIAAARSSP